LRASMAEKFHNGQLCAWPFTNKNSPTPSDF
jgi:hypothetical protein